MSEDTEVIRQQMDETKAQLAEKLETLEQQVAETVQSTGDVVSATVEAVQETVENVTGAVQGAVQSVNHAFDLRAHLETHPWYVLGGSVAVGFLAHELLSGKPSKFKVSALSDQRSASHFIPGNSAGPSLPMGNTPGTSNKQKSSSNGWQEMVMETIVGLVKDVAQQTIPQWVDAITGSRPVATEPEPEEVMDNEGPRQVYPPVRDSEESSRRLYVPGVERRHLGNSH